MPILSRILPERTSHFLRLLSEHPATIQESCHSSSSSSLLSSWPWVVGTRPLRSRKEGGPQAKVRMRLFDRSRRRRCRRVSYSKDKRCMEPSSHPSARIDDVGFAAMDQIEPPCDDIDLCIERVRRVHGDHEDDVTRIVACTISHSTNSLPPPVLNKRVSEIDGISSHPKSTGCLSVSARESTLEGISPVNV